MKQCRDFQRGDCKYGSRCKFSHERGGPSSEADKVDTWGRVDPSAPFKPWNTSGFKNRDKDRDKGGETPSGGAYNSDDTVRIWCRPNAKSFVTSMQMRRFIQACSNSVQTSSNEILDNICGGDRTGLDRITEICQCDFEVDAGPNFQKFSFQRIIVAMLKFVTDPKLSNSVLRRSVNNILNVITENLDLEQVEECLRIMEERKSIADRKMTHIDPEFWGPKSWDDLVLPISSYCEKVIPQTQAKQTSEEMLKLISRLRSIAQNVPGVGRKFKEQVQYLQKGEFHDANFTDDEDYYDEDDDDDDDDYYGNNWWKTPWKKLLTARTASDSWNSIVSCRDQILKSYFSNNYRSAVDPGSVERAVKVLRAIQRLFRKFPNDIQFCSFYWTMGRLYKYILPYCEGSKKEIREMYMLAGEVLDQVKQFEAERSSGTTSLSQKIQKMSLQRSSPIPIKGTENTQNQQIVQEDQNEDSVREILEQNQIIPEPLAGPFGPFSAMLPAPWCASPSY